MAGRLPLLPFLCIVLVLLLIAPNVSPLLVYDRLSLLNIGQSVGKLPIHDFIAQPKSPPPLLALIPPYLPGCLAAAAAEDEVREAEYYADRELSWLRPLQTTLVVHCLSSPRSTSATTCEAPRITATDGCCRPSRRPGNRFPVAGPLIGA